MKFSKLNTIYFLFTIILLVNCAKKHVPEDVLIQVGDRYITTKEFQYRAEFTPHPNFPRHDRNLEKVMLNNLILEKLFVIEHGKDSELKKNENFLGYIRGIKEQKMREQLFFKKAHD